MSNTSALLLASLIVVLTVSVPLPARAGEQADSPSRVEKIGPESDRGKPATDRLPLYLSFLRPFLGVDEDGTLRDVHVQKGLFETRRYAADLGLKVGEEKSPAGASEGNKSELAASFEFELRF